MTTTVEAVHRHLETDVALVDVLARDLLRLRRTARWLIDEYEWDTSEDAVVSAIRRYGEKHSIPPLTRDRDLLAETMVDVQTGLALLTLPRTQSTHSCLSKLWSVVESREAVAVVTGRKRFRILIEKARVDQVQGVFPPGRVADIVSPVSSIELRLPDELGASSLVGHAAGVLTHSGIEVQEVLTCRPEAFLLVDEEDTLDAFEVVGSLTREPELMCSPGEDQPASRVSGTEEK